MTVEKTIKPALKKTIEKTMNLLPMVRWDRYVHYEGSSVEVYGWIDRADAYKDFISVFFYKDGDITYSTSSAKYSLPIFKILNDGNGRGHLKCRRVEHFFKVNNMIQLKKVDNPQ